LFLAQSHAQMRPNVKITVIDKNEWKKEALPKEIA
jgi:hypothetical protein